MKPRIVFATVAVLVAATAVGCQRVAGNHELAASARGQDGMPAPAGPLAHERWRPGSLQPGSLVYDDGRRLWSVDLQGSRKLVWTHPHALVYMMAASPGGRSLALSVQAAPPPTSSRQPSFFLYWLRPDGRVQTVDDVTQYGSIETPIFLRPRRPADATRLYWIRGWDRLERGTHHLERHVMVLDRGRRRQVRFDLRSNEAADALSGYPGSPMFAAALTRFDNVPTRLEIVRAATETDRISHWGTVGSMANTDLFTGVAWPSPREYVIGVAQDAHRPEVSLVLFRVGCEYFGSHLVYRGTGIDWGYFEADWPMLPAGPDRLLVLGSDAAKRVRDGKATTAPWLALDLRTGALAPTKARWSAGAWASVEPDARVGYPRTREDADCEKYDWTFP